jgi:hypothetical protein
MIGHRFRFGTHLATAMILVLLATGVGRSQQVTIVNMIPKSLSDETNGDAEPNLAVNPSNPLQIAGSAFTPDPSGGTHAPIYVSTDGGQTWTLNSIVPSNDPNTGTGDITLRFSGTNKLYAGILSLPPAVAGDTELKILRSDSFTGPAAMKVLVDRKGVDQPYVQVISVNGKDRLYVGDNDLEGTQANDTGRRSARPSTPTARRCMRRSTAGDRSSSRARPASPRRPTSSWSATITEAPGRTRSRR